MPVGAWGPLFATRDDVLRETDSGHIRRCRTSQAHETQEAAGGASNPQIAQSLLVTRKTVEAHLISAYSKLGISSRSDLPDELRTPHDAVP